jgi:hypothetical protein
MSDSPSPRFTVAPGPDRPQSGWGITLVLGLLVAAFSTINPALLIFVPLAFLLVALPPRRGPLVVLGLVLLAVSFLGQRGGTFWWFGRGWALVLSAWFVMSLALLPQLKLTARLLAAVGGAAASAALLFLVNRRGWDTVDFTISQELRNGAADIRSFWTARMGDEPWVADMSTAVDRFADWQANAYPAMLAVASLAGLTLAWFLWRRLAARDPRPLGRLRDFRFSDHLVWVAVGGVLLLVLPFGAALTRTGANLVAFMAALYALRGFAVMLSLYGAPGLLGSVLAAMVFLLLYPIVMVTTLMVGLTDTWLDLRTRKKEREQL